MTEQPAVPEELIDKAREIIATYFDDPTVEPQHLAAAEALADAQLLAVPVQQAELERLREQAARQDRQAQFDVDMLNRTLGERDDFRAEFAQMRQNWQRARDANMVALATIRTLENERDRLQARIDAVRAQHRRDDEDNCSVCWDVDGNFPLAWPCDTVHALDCPEPEADVRAALQADQPTETRGGGAQGGEEPSENSRVGSEPGNAALEPGHGTTTPANSPRPDQPDVWRENGRWCWRSLPPGLNGDDGSCPEPDVTSPVDSGEAQAKPKPWDLVQHCCEAGTVAYPQPCPHHPAVPSTPEATS